jgi:hypothetical protein
VKSVSSPDEKALFAFVGRDRNVSSVWELELDKNKSGTDRLAVKSIFKELNNKKALELTL